MNRRGILAATLVSLIVIISFIPAQSIITFGNWRDINPTQYTQDPAGTLRGIYVRNGGSGSIGAGDGWAVGGDNVTFVGSQASPVLAHYDGFSWVLAGSPIGNSIYYSANFCTSPGAPGVGLCSPNGDGSDGWIVGTVCQNIQGPPPAGCVLTGGSVLPPSSAGAAALYWDGATLTSVTSGLTNAMNLTSVFMVCHSPQYGSGCPSAFAPGLTYAVGQNTSLNTAKRGAIWAFQGNPKLSGGWTYQPVYGVPTTGYNSVYMFQDSSGNLEGFAVGNGGVVARLFGGGWVSTLIGPGANDLLGVVVDQTNPIDAWAVGRGGQLWNFKNGFWTGYVSPLGTSQDLYSIQLVSTSEGWVVGTGGAILHSTALPVWLALTGPLQTAVGPGITLLGTSFTGSGNGWAVGTQGVILQTGNSGCGSAVPQPCWGGSTNILRSSPLNPVGLNTVFELGTSDAWAGGIYDPGSLCCSLIHWDGIKWHRAAVAPSQTLNPDIWAIFMVSSGEGWALGGTLTRPEALLWNGQSWTGQPIDSTGCAGGTTQCEPRSVFVISGGTGGDGWAVGLRGNMWRHQSGTWGGFTSGTASNLNSVFINNPGATAPTPAGFAVGNGGTVLALTITNGIPTWSSIGPILGVTANLNGIYFKDSNHGWIVGASSTILQTVDGGASWTGGTGQVTGMPVGRLANLTSVFVDAYGTGQGNGDGWAVGDDTTGPPGNLVFAHWYGVSWQYTPLSAYGTISSGMSLRSVYLTGPQDGWAVGMPGGAFATPPSPSLSGIIHLDPFNPPVGPQQVTVTVTPTTSITSTTSSATSSSVALTSSSQATTVTTASTATTTQISTSISTSVVSTTAVVTQTVTTASVTTPMTLPAIPGFPWESIIAGIMIGVALLGIARRNKRNSR